jgi:hypothetical protein
MILQNMTRLGAKMRDIHDGSGVIGVQDQQVVRLKRLKPFPGLENGQGAQQAQSV